MGSISLWDWLYGLFGNIPLPDDYEPQPGDRIATTIGIENIGVFAIDDSKILGELDAISDTEFEDEIYKETGVKVSMVDRRGKTISSGNEWEYEYTYDVEETPGTPGIIAVAVAIVAVCVAIIGVLWAIDTYIASNTKIVTPWGEMNLFPILAVGVIVFIILMILKEIMGSD